MGWVFFVRFGQVETATGYGHPINPPIKPAQGMFT
jgi:hypothetical protein